MTILENNFVLLTTYANYQSEAEYEKHKYDDETPLALLAIQRDFLESFVSSETEYVSLEDFFGNYTYDDVEDIQNRAEQAEALAFAYRPEMDPLYQFPEKMTPQMAAALVDFTEREPLFERLKRQLGSNVSQSYMAFADGILTPSFDSAAIVVDMLSAAGEPVMAVPASEEEASRGLVLWSDRTKAQAAFSGDYKSIISMLEEMELDSFPVRFLDGNATSAIDLNATCYEFLDLDNALAEFKYRAQNARCVVMYGRAADGRKRPIFIGGKGHGLTQSGAFIGDELFSKFDTRGMLVEMDGIVAAWLLVMSFKVKTESPQGVPNSDYLPMLFPSGNPAHGVYISLFAADDDASASKAYTLSLHIIDELNDRECETRDVPDLQICAISDLVRQVLDRAKSFYQEKV